MGTRGAYGFRMDKTDKISYNHYDSYPSELGAQVLTFLSKTKPIDVRKIAKGIILVAPDSKPTPAQIKACASTTNLNVSDNSTNDWYCLLREAQGHLEAHKKVPYMRDAHDFLGNSSCEWTYIVNVDDGVLEVYRGYNKNPKAEGRYAALDSGDGYYGVKLILTIPLISIFKARKKRIESYCAKMEKAAEEDEKKPSDAFPLPPDRFVKQMGKPIQS